MKQPDLVKNRLPFKKKQDHHTNQYKSIQKTSEDDDKDDIRLILRAGELIGLIES